MTEKYVGYSLLAVGVILMIFATIQIIFVFTGKARPIQLFELDKPEPTTQNQAPTSPDELMRQLESGNIGTLLQGSGEGGIPGLDIIDPESLNQILNLTIYYFIMQFLLSLGFKLSSLGVQMVRPLKVEVNQKRLEKAINEGNQNSVSK